MSYDSKLLGFVSTLGLSTLSFLILIIVTETNFRPWHEESTPATHYTEQHVATIAPTTKSRDRIYYVGLVATVPDRQRNIQYAFYAYLNAFRWLNLGFQPIFILIASQSSNTSEYLIQEMEKLAPTYIVYANMTSRISQISRLFLFLHSEIRETDYIITTDSDLLPLRKKEYEIEQYTIKATTSSPKKGVYSYLALSNLIMSKKTWKEVMFFHDCYNSSSAYKKFDSKAMHAYQQVHGECPDKKIFNKARFRPEYFNEYFESHFGVSEESSKNKTNWFEDQQMMSYRIAQWVMRGKNRQDKVYYGRGKSPLTRLNNMDSQIREETLDVHLADRPSSAIIWEKLKRIITTNQLLSENQVYQVEKMRAKLCKNLPK